MSRLYPCVYCTEDGYCKKYSDDEVTSWCVQSPCKDEKPSNADRIRAMKDEELAEFLTTFAAFLVSQIPDTELEDDYQTQVLNWLLLEERDPS